MTDFGQLDEQLDAYDISFVFKGEEYHITPSAEQVLEFHRDYFNARKKNEDNGMGVWARVAPLLGSKFNAKTAKITGGILGEIMDNGASYSQMERLVSAVHFKSCRVMIWLRRISPLAIWEKQWISSRARATTSRATR